MINPFRRAMAQQKREWAAAASRFADWMDELGDDGAAAHHRACARRLEQEADSLEDEGRVFR